MSTLIKLTDHERRVLAGIFARTNMGMEMPDKKRVADALDHVNQKWYRQPHNKSGHDYAIHFCSEFMETEHHEEMFEQEASSWYKEFGKRGQNTRAYIQKTWPEKSMLMWGV